MRYTPMLRICTLLLFTLTATMHIGAQDMIFQLRSGYDVKDFQAEIRIKLNPSDIKCISQDLQAYRLKAQNIAPSISLDDLKKLESVEHAKFNQAIQWRDTEPNDTEFSEQWQMARIGATKVWDSTTGGTNTDGDRIVVAVLDSGVDPNHPDLANNIWKNNSEIPNNLVDDDNNGYIDDYTGLNMDDFTDNHPLHFHGQGVTGIIGAQGNNDEGIAGINWDVELMIISEARTEADVVEALNYVLEMRRRYDGSNGTEGAYVVCTNFSAGINGAFGEDFPLWCSMYDLLGQEGILSVAATTNDQTDIDEFGDMPSTCTSEYLIVTTSSDQDDEHGNTGYGTIHVDISAPGKSIRTTDLNGTYQSFGGTSSATPHVAAAVGLLHSIKCDQFTADYKANPSQTALQLKESLLDESDKFSSLSDRTASGGRLNMFNSLLKLGEKCAFIEPGLQLADISPNPLVNRDLLLGFAALDASEEHYIRVFSSDGKLFFSYDCTEISTTNLTFISVSTFHWPPGMYYAVLYSETDFTTSNFIVL